MHIKILLADDSITIQKVVGIIFGGEEYSLTVVDNGRDAVEKALELNPDVLLIDALMPGMSGYEVCESVRATPSISTKPILLLTGSFEPFDETKAKNCGADDFLAKPFESQQIVTKVKGLIELGLSRTIIPATAERDSFVPQPVSEVAKEPASANDIWGTFTTTEGSTPVAETSPAMPATEQEADVFAMFNEGVGAPAEPPTAVVLPVEESTGSKWIAEEETFAFEEDATVEQPASSAIVPVAAAPMALTEEQLREAIVTASKDVIERIVWEVVPDLAEVLIKEAIRKIKEGQ